MYQLGRQLPQSQTDTKEEQVGTSDLGTVVWVLNHQDLVRDLTGDL